MDRFLYLSVTNVEGIDEFREPELFNDISKGQRRGCLITFEVPNFVVLN